MDDLSQFDKPSQPRRQDACSHGAVHDRFKFIRAHLLALRNARQGRLDADHEGRLELKSDS